MSRKTWISLLGIMSVSTAAALVGLRTMSWFPPDTLDIVPHTRSTKSVPKGATLKLLMWNIQYGASRNYHFFYDGGTDVGVQKKHVTETMDALATVIRTHDPDIVMLQEVDRGSRRTHHIDQHIELLNRLDYPDHVSTSYHNVAFVPHPTWEPIGKVDMHLSVLSKYRIDSATRYQLPLLNESAIRRFFNLRRALLEIRLPTTTGDDLLIFNTHLSAFSQRDGTLERQIAVLNDHMQAAEQAKTSWLLGGDLNALAPTDDPTRLGEDAKWYATGDSPIEALFTTHQHPVPTNVYATDPQPWRTYLPPGATTPDRTLDYIFHGSQLNVLSYSVLQDEFTASISDHLPIIAEIQIP